MMHKNLVTRFAVGYMRCDPHQFLKTCARCREQLINFLAFRRLEIECEAEKG